MTLQWRKMRHPALLLAFLLAAWSGHAAEEMAPAEPAPAEPAPGKPAPAERAPAEAAAGETVADYGTVLPGAEPLLDHGAVVAVRIVGRHGFERRPLAGAIVRVFDEDTSPDTVRPPLLAETRADEHGFANLPTRGFEETWVHLVAEAPGYGVAWRFTAAESWPEEMVLVPAENHELLVLDPFGRPLPGAEITLFPCCPHSPALLSATTDEAGRAILGGWTPGDDFSANLWIRAEGVDPGPYDLPEHLVVHPVATLDTRPGRTARGVVLDEEGCPLAGAAVRVSGYPRGPAETTDAEGAFALRGIPEGRSITIYDPRASWLQGPALIVDEFSEEVPLRAVLRRGHPVSLAEGEPRHTVSIHVRSGSECPVTATRLSDGFTASATAVEFPGGIGVLPAARLAVPAGRYRIEAGGGFSGFERETTEAELPTPDHDPIRLSVRSSPEFELEPPGSEEPDWIVLQIPGLARRIDRRNVTVHLPAEAPAGVRLVFRGPRWWTGFAPVGAPEDGRRRARWSLPEPTTIRVLARDGAGEIPAAETFLGTENSESQDPDSSTGSRTLTTGYAGRHRLWVTAPGRQTRTIEVDLPAAAGTELDLGEVLLGRTTERRILVRHADGTAVEAAFFSDGERRRPIPVDAEEGATLTLGPEPEQFEVMAAGHFPRCVALGLSSPPVIEFPAGRITLHVRDASGAGLRAVVYIDGERFTAEDGSLAVLGVPVGKHVLLVGASDHVGQVRRIDLAEGEAREIDAVLRPR
jgi:hypothetical protein